MQTLTQMQSRRSVPSCWTIATNEVIELACDLYRAGFGSLDKCLTEARAWIARRYRREVTR